MPQKFSIDVTCNGTRRKLVLARSAGESVRHVSLKLLAYLLYFDDEPVIEIRVGQHYKPDLVCRDGHDVTLWVECGEVGVKKLDRVSTKNHRARVVVVKPTRGTAEQYKLAAEKRLKRPERVTYLAFDDGFLRSFVEAFSTRTTLTASVPPARDSLDLTLNGTALRTAVHAL